MSNWVDIKDQGHPQDGALVDVFVKVEPSGYHGRIIDVFYNGTIWCDREGRLDDIFQNAVTHYMVSPENPK